jgi:hypothetical protein
MTRPIVTAAAATLAIVIGSLIQQVPHLPGGDVGIRRFTTPPVSADFALSQVFEMPTGGLSAIEFRPAQVGSDVAGALKLTLAELQGNASRTVASAEIDAAELLRKKWYTFAFPALGTSTWRRYRFDITASAQRPPRGVAIWATRGTSNPTHMLLYNNVSRWGEMAFRVSAPTEPVATALLVASPASKKIALIALSAYLALLALLARRILRSAGAGA